MTDGLTPKPPGRVRGWLFEKGRSGNPAGPRIGCRNKTSIADREHSQGPSSRAEDPSTSQPRRKAVASALASGMITPGEAARIAAVVDPLVRAIALQPTGDILLQIRCRWGDLQ